MNPIEYLKVNGFTVTSDPSKYSSKVWGLRNYTVGGYNYDNFCGGYHRAYDLVKYHGAPIPAVFSGVVTSGTSPYGNFGGTVVIANKSLGYQVIYGHLKRPLSVKIGQKVAQGQTIGYQSNTNYNNVFMASHLHIQFQKYGYIHGEENFVCTGISPLNINVGEARRYKNAWLWTGQFTTREIINIRDYPSLSGQKLGISKRNQTFLFDKLYDNDGYWWLRCSYNGRKVFIACGKKTDKVNFLNSKLYGKVSKLNTSKGRE